MVFKYHCLSLLCFGGAVVPVVLGTPGGLLAGALDVIDDSSPVVLMAEHS